MLVVTFPVHTSAPVHAVGPTTAHQYPCGTENPVLHTTPYRMPCRMEEEQIPRSEVDPNPPSRDPEGHDLRMDGVGSKVMHYSTTPPLQPAVVLYVVLYSLPYFPTPLRDADTHKGCTPGTRPMAMDPYPEVRRGGLLLLMY